jgi:hypothetical protein
MAEIRDFDPEMLVRRGNYLVLITPEVAGRLLEYNDHNRRQSKRNIQLYARDMLAGRWDPDASDIKIARTGALVDGQNRLMACQLAGVPFPTLLRTGVKLDTKQHVDVGKKRTVADMLKMQELPTTASPSLIGASVALYMRYMDRITNHGGKRALDVKGEPMTHDEVLDFLDKHPMLVHFAADAGALHRIMPAIPGSAFGTFLTLAGEVDVKAAELFASRLRAGEFGNPTRHDPMVALVQYAARVRVSGGMGNGGYRGRNAQESHLLALIRAWNADRQGEELSTIVIKITDRLVLPT